MITNVFSRIQFLISVVPIKVLIQYPKNKRVNNCSNLFLEKEILSLEIASVNGIRFIFAKGKINFSTWGNKIESFVTTIKEDDIII